MTLKELIRFVRSKSKEAVENEWKEIHRWKPYLHFCPAWDYLLIDKGQPEFESCTCEFPREE